MLQGRVVRRAHSLDNVAPPGGERRPSIAMSGTATVMIIRMTRERIRAGFQNRWNAIVIRNVVAAEFGNLRRMADPIAGGPGNGT